MRTAPPIPRPMTWRLQVNPMVGSERRGSVPVRDLTVRPVGVARQIDRKIHATVDVTPGRGDEPAHPTSERAASPAERCSGNEPSEHQVTIGIERGDLTEGLDPTTFAVHRDDDAATVGSVRKEQERQGDPLRRGARTRVVVSAPRQRDGDDQERHPTRRPQVADPHVASPRSSWTMRRSTWHQHPAGASRGCSSLGRDGTGRRRSTPSMGPHRSNRVFVEVSPSEFHAGGIERVATAHRRRDHHRLQEHIDQFAALSEIRRRPSGCQTWGEHHMGVP